MIDTKDPIGWQQFLDIFFMCSGKQDTLFKSLSAIPGKYLIVSLLLCLRIEQGPRPVRLILILVTFRIFPFLIGGQWRKALDLFNCLACFDLARGPLQQPTSPQAI